MAKDNQDNDLQFRISTIINGYLVKSMGSTGYSRTIDEVLEDVETIIRANLVDWEEDD